MCETNGLSDLSDSKGSWSQSEAYDPHSLSSWIALAEETIDYEEAYLHGGTSEAREVFIMARALLLASRRDRKKIAASIAKRATEPVKAALRPLWKRLKDEPPSKPTP